MSARAVDDGAGRFTIGLVVDVARVLESHGYGPFGDGQSYVALLQHLFHLLHGDTHGHCTGRVA